MSSLSDDDVKTFREMTQDWSEACLAQDWDRTLSLCTEDVVYMPPDQPVLRGPEELRAWLSQFPPMDELKQQVEHAEGNGDLAVIRVTSAVKTKMEEKPVAFTAKVLCTLVKNPADKWLFNNISLSWDRPMSEIG